MRNSILARNVLIHNEIERISNECVKNNIKLVLLKGAALIELFPEYSFEREMEDIDVLVEKKNYIKFIKILKKLGYTEVPYDPNAMFNEKLNLKIDISTKLWYLSQKKYKRILNQLIKINNFYVLPKQEMLRHIIYHMYFEHNYEFQKWNNDVKLLMQDGTADINVCIPTFIRWLTDIQVFYKGHIIKLLVLPWDVKIKYIIEKFFPTHKFLVRRYNIRTLGILFPLVLFYRWIKLVYNTIKLTNNLIDYLFLRLSLAHN